MKKLFLLCVLCVLCGKISAQEAPAPIRISGDSAVRYNPSVTDSNTTQSPQFIIGDQVTFDVGLFDRGVFRSNTIAQFTNATLGVWQTQNDTNPPLMLATVTNGGTGWNTNCQYTNWSNNPAASFTNWNLEFNFSDSQTSILVNGLPLNGQDAQGYWLRLFCTTTNATPFNVTYLECPITVYNGPITALYTPPFAWLEYVIENGNLVPAIYDPVSGHYFTIEIDTVYGVRSLSLGDTPY